MMAGIFLSLTQEHMFDILKKTEHKFLFGCRFLTYFFDNRFQVNKKNIYIMGVGRMETLEEAKDLLAQKGEAERLYRIYRNVQSGNKAALNQLFKTADNREVCSLDKMNKEYELSRMDNVLDAELVFDSEENRKEREWLHSVNSKVIFQFPCLNKMLYKKKKSFLSKAKNTGYENGKRIKNSSHSKFYEGEYDISDLNEIMYETIIEVFSSKTDEDNCLTLDGKKNIKTPVCDGVSLLKNISYFTSRKINRRTKGSYLDILDTEYWGEEQNIEVSYFDKYEFKNYLQNEGGSARMMMYAEYLEWLERFDIHKLFKANARDIRAIIETIMNCEETFITDISGNDGTGLGMRLVQQKMLQKIIKSKYNLNIRQENISKNMEIIEQRLLNHLLYALNYKIDKAEESKGIYEKESERFLYERDKKSYVKVFSRTSYELYEKSRRFINGNADSIGTENYFKAVKKYEDTIVDIVSAERGKKKYDMINLMYGNDDLVEDKRATLFHIAKTVILYYQRKEDEYKRREWRDYKKSKLIDWGKGYWEAELEEELLNIKLWTDKNVKKPIWHKIKKDKLMVYCGYTNYYFCDEENRIETA